MLLSAHGSNWKTPHAVCLQTMSPSCYPVSPCSLVSFPSYSLFPPCYPGSLPCYPIVLMFSFLNSLNVDRCVMFGGSQKFFFCMSVRFLILFVEKKKALFNFILLALLLKNNWSISTYGSISGLCLLVNQCVYLPLHKYYCGCGFLLNIEYVTF